jgi:hypothetical protein
MITLRSDSHIDGVFAEQVFNFLISADDDAYQRWWPGVHLQFHALRRVPGHVGTVVYMDEFVGRRRVRLHGVVVEAVPGEKITWQLKKGVRLPARVTLELADDPEGVAVQHTVRAGFDGVGQILDPLFRLYLSRQFVAELDKHVRAEFPMLRELLSGVRDPVEHKSIV